VVTNVKALPEFEAVLKENASRGNLVVVHFWTAWAPQCKQVTDVITALAQEPIYKDVAFVEVEAEDLAELSRKYNVFCCANMRLDQEFQRSCKSKWLQRTFTE